MNGPLLIAVLGAESTGKTTLAAALAPRLATLTGRRATWVPELLREWCQRFGRTPQAHEQAPLMRAMHERIDAAAATHDIVVCDTTALMTALYSQVVFGDTSLRARGVALHRRLHATLLMALDLPWVADGIQRDGPQVQPVVDGLLRQWLDSAGLPWSLVGGQGAARLENAVDALAPLLRAQAATGSGLFTRLAERDANATTARWRVCDCDDPACERRLLHGASAPPA